MDDAYVYLTRYTFCMDDELSARLAAVEKQMAEVYAMAQKLYKLIYWTVVASIIATVLFVLLPLIGLLFEIPNFINTYGNIDTIGNLQ